MSDKLHATSLEGLGASILGELEQNGSIFSLPKQLFFRPSKNSLRTKIGNQHIDTPIGVAAGPHSQMAQNIVCAWLCGARYIELKTVQTLDNLTISKPCIDMADIGYNCEWSQELSLKQSFEEYLKAQILIAVLSKHLGYHKTSLNPGFVFNVSVGYNLAGIKKRNVQSFLSKIYDTTRHKQRLLKKLSKAAQFEQLDISNTLSSSVTLSTMHGCPPEEIESIGLYLIQTLGLNTTIKLNPTLLGPKLLRHILHSDLGYTDVEVPNEAFEHDPKFVDAVAIIKSLKTAASKNNVEFGIKLSNTLETSNLRGVLPDSEQTHYLSGRALHPLTVNLAKLFCDEFGNSIPISFCGGADAYNVSKLVACNLVPVTVASDLLKPGGYGRLAQYIGNLEQSKKELQSSSFNLTKYAKEVLEDPAYKKSRTEVKTKTTVPLSMFDCVYAPCISSCPTNQDVPRYVNCVSNNQIQQAMRVISKDNCLPSITGYICDHKCTQTCVRNHYDSPIQIRQLKRFVADKVKKREPHQKLPQNGKSVAIIGAGPSGLSAAHFCALFGFKVTVFESESASGGLVKTVIPSFRISNSTIEKDIDEIVRLGVEFRFGVKLGADLRLSHLKKQGFNYIYISTGAKIGRFLRIANEDSHGVYDCLDFLEQVKQNKIKQPLGNVLVIGGGNSAMDAARAAIRIVGKHKKVTVVYRRTISQMPASNEEIEAALNEGVLIKELLAPSIICKDEEGKVKSLICTPMKLSILKSNDRPRPIPIENATEQEIPSDCIIVAISQSPDTQFLKIDKVALAKDGAIVTNKTTMETSVSGVYAGGDAVNGGDSAVAAMAHAKSFAYFISKQTIQSSESNSNIDINEHIARRSLRQYPDKPTSNSLDKDDIHKLVENTFRPKQAIAEASRCLECDQFCGICVTVCPNRANFCYTITPNEIPTDEYVLTKLNKLQKTGSSSFTIEQKFQFANFANWCNECGNCETFCPKNGAPFVDKPRICIGKTSFEKELRAYAFKFLKNGWQVKFKNNQDLAVLKLTNDRLDFNSPKMKAKLKASDFSVVSINKGDKLGVDEKVTLKECAELFTLGTGLANSPFIFGLLVK